MTLQDHAQCALALWGGTGTPRLISHRENAVFEVALPKGRAALRLHRPGYRTADEIRSELVWATALAQSGLPVPEAVPARDGALLHSLPDGPDVTVTTWIDGAPVGDGDTALGADGVALHHRLGDLLARLHDLSDAWTPPADFTRPPWDRAALTGPDPAWGRYWENPSLTGEERALILQARAKADAVLRDGSADIGLIHADALRENVFQTDQGLTLIDFDDSGVGYRLYDLGAALSQSLEDPRLPQFAAALVQGYAARRPVQADRLAMFLMLRCFSSLGWVMPRYAADDPKQVHYKARALKAARAFLTGPALFSG
jgi:Ser/Thr protein kinase RdoA (MazF antagonist)